MIKLLENIIEKLQNWLLILQKNREEQELGGVRSTEWPRIRASYLKGHPACAVCGTKKDIDVHHCIPYHIEPDLELNLHNLLTLCTKHHFLFGHLQNWSSWNDRVRHDAEEWYNKIQERP